MGELMGQSTWLAVVGACAVHEGEPEVTKKECPLGTGVQPLDICEVGQVLVVGPHHKCLDGLHWITLGEYSARLLCLRHPPPPLTDGWNPDVTRWEQR